MRFLWQQIASPTITEIFCNSNFDGIVFDLEHGCFNNETLYSCIQICDLSEKQSLIRTSHLDRQAIRMALDANCSGVILSTVENEEEAQEFYDYCIYPYKKREERFRADGKGVIRRNFLTKTGGRRGQGLVRENKWGATPLKFRKPLLIPQIETLKGVENIEKISQIDFDYYMVGPYDLSASVGEVGDFKSESFKNSIESLKKAVGSKLGFHLPSKIKEQYENYKEYEFLALAMDSTLLVEGLNNISELF
jgi:2-keto-3-deoxy-L-rhamnonate aldolase RhmA